MSQWDSLIASAGQKYNVDPQLIASIVKTESSGNPNAYNAEYGATGLGQQIPATAKALGIDPKDPAQSIEGVAKLLNENLNRYGSPEQAVLAYHGGTDQANWGPKTQDYLRKVSANYGAPTVAKTSAAPAATPDAFEEMFGPRPTAAAAPDADPFEAMFGPRPSAAAPAAQAQAAAPAATPAQPAAQPGIIGQIPDMAWQGLQALGAQGISNANAVGRGISDALDAPAEWLASGAEASGLTGLLGKAGINMPTADQQKQLDIQSRAQYDARNPEPGIQGMASRVGGNLIGVMAPVAGVEAGAVQGARAIGNATKAAPETMAKIEAAIRGQGGLLSRMGYNAGQGAIGGALLSGGQADQNAGDSALLGAGLGAAVPIVGGVLKYPVNAVKSLVAPFTDAGRASIAGNVIRQEAGAGGLPAVQGALASATSGAAPQAEVGALGALTAEQAAGRAATGGRLATDLTEYVPGSTPTLGQAAQNPGILALENAAKSRAPNLFAERDMANYQARNAFLDQIKGTPDTLMAAAAAREEQALPLLGKALEGADKANVNPVVDTIRRILGSEAGQRDSVVNALKSVQSKLSNTGSITKSVMTPSARGDQLADVNQLYGIRKSINDQLENVSGRDNTAAQQASRELIQVRDAIDKSIEQAAPGFKNYLQTYSEMSKPISAQNYLQGLNLTDASSQRITLPAMKNAMLKIEKLRKAPGANDAKAISDEQMAMLQNLHKDLQREYGTAAGKVTGSNTFQNLATNQLIDAMVPSGIGGTILSKTAPSAVGGALGFALGGPVGAGIGAVGAQQASSIMGRALSEQSPEIEARLIDFLLNPKGAEVLKQMRSADPQGLNQLLRRAGGATPAAATSGAGNNR